MTDLIVKQKTEDMIAYGYVALRQFPKAERHDGGVYQVMDRPREPREYV